MSKNNIISCLEERFLASFPLHGWAGCRTLVAVSGGPDSVALLHLLLRCGGPREQIVVGHVNHRLRGHDSELDAEFVAELCHRLGVKLVMRAVDPPSGGGDGLEEAARRLRYGCLREFAEQEGTRFVLTAHTADDQAETILYRLFRGTGLHGLRGIPRSRPFGPAALVRPLLNFRRRELLDYLHELGETYREDRTNDSLTFARNRVRHLVIPAALQVHPAAIDGVLKLGEVAQETWGFIQRQVELAIDACVKSRAKNLVVIDRGKLARLDPFLIQGLLVELWRSQQWPMRDLSRKHILAMCRFVTSSPSKPGSDTAIHLPGHVECRVDEENVILRLLTSRCDEHQA